jgi:hypothetical protein
MSIYLVCCSQEGLPKKTTVQPTIMIGIIHSDVEVIELITYVYRRQARISWSLNVRRHWSSQLKLNTIEYYAAPGV